MWAPRPLGQVKQIRQRLRTVGPGGTVMYLPLVDTDLVTISAIQEAPHHRNISFSRAWSSVAAPETYSLCFALISSAGLA